MLGDDFLVGDLVNFAAALSAVALTWIVGLEADLQRSEERRRARSGPGLTVVDEIPGDEFAVAVDGRLHFIQLGGALGFPAMSILARPLNPPRPPACPESK